MINCQLEIACFNYESAIIAQQNGADRIELCDAFEEGGTTPSFESVKRVRESSDLDLFVMIRPRGGDFVYTNQEFEQMKDDILRFKQLKVNGFVFGILNDEGHVNKEQNAELVKLAFPLSCTFHRAFDRVKDMFQAIEEVIDCGFQTILTSGQKATAVEGIPMLKDLIGLAKGRIVIMPGGGVRSSNVSVLTKELEVSWVHSSAITDKSNLANAEEVRLLKRNL